jgi:hypothetical protein
MDTKNLYTKIKSCLFIVCFSIMNRISYVQIVARKINKKYNLSNMIPSFLKYKKKSDDNKNCEFIINTKNKLIHKTIDDISYYKLHENTESNEKSHTQFNEKSHDFQPCKFTFTSVNLIDKTNNKEYDLDFCSNEFNYFCVGNIINKDFLNWSLNYFHNTKLPDEYTVSIIDQDCEMVDLEKNQCIHLEEDKYSIV